MNIGHPSEPAGENRETINLCNVPSVPSRRPLPPGCSQRLCEWLAGTVTSLYTFQVGRGGTLPSCENQCNEVSVPGFRVPGFPP